jgi:hypothetical protein
MLDNVGEVEMTEPTPEDLFIVSLDPRVAAISACERKYSGESRTNTAGRVEGLAMR